MEIGELDIQYILPEDLKANPLNFRRHRSRQTRDVTKSLNEFGMVLPCILNKRTGHLLDGHLRKEITTGKGKRVPTVVVDWPVEKERRFLAMLDRTTGLAYEDEAALGTLLASIDDTTNLPAFDDNEIKRLIQSVSGEQASTEPEEDDSVLELELPRVARSGDLWVLGGKHRLLVGDSTDTEQVGRLMAGEKAALLATDPPYGVGISDDSTGRSRARGERLASDGYDPIAGDESTEIYGKFLDACLPYLVEDWAGYLFFGTNKADQVIAQLNARNIRIGQWLCWRKNRQVLSFFKYQIDWEPFLFIGPSSNVKPNGRWYGVSGAKALWPIDCEPHGGHPTAKPVALWAQMIQDMTVEGEVVLEPFLGAGAALVAAERLSRSCYAMEIEPKWADVAIRRWLAGGGKEAVEETSGVSFRDREAGDVRPDRDRDEQGADSGESEPNGE